jgi:hypothetical protein
MELEASPMTSLLALAKAVVGTVKACGEVGIKLPLMMKRQTVREVFLLAAYILVRIRCLETCGKEVLQVLVCLGNLPIR